ncbi:putative methionyl-tRNA synthetase [Hordeum vulgare]|nr:putative methionyl-tRNA synthetase [Hordeum vulgare]
MPWVAPEVAGVTGMDVEPPNRIPACRSEGWEEKPNPNPHSFSSPAWEGKPPIPSSSRRHGSPDRRLAPTRRRASRLARPGRRRARLAHPSPAPPAQAAAALAPHGPATVADVVAATHVGAKRRRTGHAPPPPAPAAPATVQHAPAKKSCSNVSSRGPRGATSKAAGASPKRKKVTARKKPAPLVIAVTESPPAMHEVFKEMANPTSFMHRLQDAEVDLGAPPQEPFGEEVGEDEEDEGDDEEEVAEIGEEAFTAASRPHARSTNYTEAEDILLVRAWASVGMDATTGTDQTGKRYWQRIEDNYCRIKLKNCGFLSRSYQSLQGWWDLMKPSCARWSAAMDQVRDAPPSGTVESDYETIAGMRYKEMAASKGKPFPFKHAWAILQTFDKWKLRDQETAPKKSAMLRMDDSEDEEKERNLGKPEGTKKGKQRVKMEGEASSLREKMEQMMKSREELTRMTLETKILITEKKKEVKLAQVEAKREEAKRKADLEERMIKVKEAKVWK